jgi:alpha-methylacyl-CoA racemase
MTGWGQDGPYAQSAGHDINYIALAGALAHFARRDSSPTPPLNMVGDFGGGGMFLAFGVVCALLEAQRSGAGQVVDAAMVDGVAMLMAQFWSGIPTGQFDENNPGTNLLDTGAHFYEVYRCADGKHISIGSVEPQFYAELLRLTGLSQEPDFARQMDPGLWQPLKTRMQETFRTKTRDEWCEIMEGTDVCFAPVLTMTEAAVHPHNISRGTFTEVGGLRQPAPAPRFSRTSPAIQRPPALPGQHSAEVLADWGIALERIEQLIALKAVIGTRSPIT